VQKKVKKILDWLIDIISKWNGIAAVVLGEVANVETYDPYFTIDLDVYFRGSLLPSNDRRERFDNPGGFETSPIYPIDRFLAEELPVSAHYKDVSRMSLLVKRVEEQTWVFRSESTHLLYRIQNGRVLYSKGDWLEQLKQRLDNIPEGFWKSIMEAARFSLDHYLNGIGAAVYRGDNLYYQISASGFCQSLCSYVFALNKRLEPTGRLLHDHIRGLKMLPDEFLGRFESFIRPDAKLPPERKFEIAQLLAKSIGSV
jgi:hypothetical protein